MKNFTKFLNNTKRLKSAEALREEKAPFEGRINEEELFNLFTANIIKLKKKFIR